MSESVGPAAELQGLRARLATGQASVDEVYETFETLTYQLPLVPARTDLALRELINDIELARFTLLAADQSAAVEDVLARAQPLFDAHST